MPWLFRSMKECVTGSPVVGENARTLGVRPGNDVPATAQDDIVLPGSGGLSVAPDDPMNLPSHRRPPEFQGVGKDPVWMVSSEELGPDLAYRPDPDRPGHGFVEPTGPATLVAFQRALAKTREAWRKIGQWPVEWGETDAT